MNNYASSKFKPKWDTWLFYVVPNATIPGKTIVIENQFITELISKLPRHLTTTELKVPKYCKKNEHCIYSHTRFNARIKLSQPHLSTF
jgi:hypothetical protein